MSSITNLNPSTALPLWNNFITSLPAPAPFSYNPSLFSFYQTCFHWKPYYFFLYSEEKLVAVFPLVNTGKRWVSLPHFSYGGIMSKNDSNIGSDVDLIHQLVFLIQNRKMTAGFYHIDMQDVLQIQNNSEQFFIRTTNKPDADTVFTKVSSILPLPKTIGELQNKLSSNLRRKIHKTVKNGLKVSVGEVKLLDLFYKIYARKMSRLGSPAYGKAFFKTLMESWQFGETKIFLALNEKKVIGAAFLQSYFGFYENTWFATDEKFFKYYVSDYLHENMIKHAISKGGKYYSFGRSTPGNGVYCYKNHWPVEDLPIYQFGENSRLKKHPEFGNLWKTMPRFITRPLGSYLIEHIY